MAGETLTAEQAIDLLRQNPGDYSTREALRELASRVSTDSPGRLTVLYSGNVADGVHSSQIVAAMIESGEDIRAIDRTDAARLLQSREFVAATARAHGISYAEMTSPGYRGPATEWLYHPTQGPWADASARFADGTVGEVRAIVSGADPGRVFGATELPHILQNPNVTSIEGIPREELLARQASHGSASAFEMVAARANERAGDFRIAVDSAGAPLRNGAGNLMLDSRAYLARSGIDGVAPDFTAQTQPLSGRMNPPSAHVLAGQRQLETSWSSVPDVDDAIRGGSAASPRVRAGAALGIAGLVLDAYDAAESVRTASRLNAEGNRTGAESELIHFGSRTAGAVAGAGAGFMFGAAVGVETGPGLFVTGLIGGAVGVFAGDKFAEWTDNRRIYNQDDRQGNTWSYDPDNPALGWQRRAPIDASDDAIDNPMRGNLRASPAQANELNYQSSGVSAELVLAGPPPQRDPFSQPAGPNDSPSAAPAPWTRDAETGEWERMVVLGYGGRGPVPTRLDTASPERAAELDRAAAEVVLQNAANSPAAIATRFEDAYIRNGWSAYGPMPEAVTAARTDIDTLVASDGNRYQRRTDGEWISEGLIYNSTASGNLRDELDATRDLLAARLPPPQPIPEPPALTEDARLRDALSGAYANANVTPSEERLDAAVVAVRATWAANGLDPNTTALQLQRGPDGRYSEDSAIASLRLEADGRTYAIAAVTTPEDLQRAQSGVSPPASAPEHPVEPARDGGVPASRDGAALRLDDPAHPNHTMFATLLDTVHARDRALGRAPDDLSLQLAGGLTAQALARGLDTIGFAAFTPDGTKVAMTSTADPNAPRARTAVGQVGDLVGQPLAQSSEQVADLGLRSALAQPTPDRTMPREERSESAMRESGMRVG